MLVRWTLHQFSESGELLKILTKEYADCMIPTTPLTPSNPLPSVQQAVATLNTVLATHKAAIVAAQADQTQLTIHLATAAATYHDYEQALADLTAVAQVPVPVFPATGPVQPGLSPQVTGPVPQATKYTY